MELDIQSDLANEQIVDDDWCLLRSESASGKGSGGDCSSSPSSAAEAATDETSTMLTKMKLIQAKKDAKRRLYFDEFKTNARIRSTVEDRVLLAKRDNVHHGVHCKLCTEEIRGARWTCKQCPRWDVCQACLSLTGHESVHPDHTFIRILLEKDDIYPEKKNQEKGEGKEQLQPFFLSYVAMQTQTHWGVRCNSCKEPIVGTRYDCAIAECQAQSLSFCQDCEALPVPCHPLMHPLIKYKLQKYRCQPIEYLPETVVKGNAPSFSGDDVAECLSRHAQKAMTLEEREATVARMDWLTSRREQHKRRNRR